MQHTVITGNILDDGSEMIQQLKEKFEVVSKTSANSHCFAQKLDSEEDSGGIWCDKTHSTKVKEDCRRFCKCVLFCLSRVSYFILYLHI